MSAINVKNSILSSIEEIPEASLKKLEDLAFKGWEKGDAYSDGANDVLGVLIGAYDIEEVLEKLGYKSGVES